MSTNLKWSDTLPTEPGMYWFYGDLLLGQMGSDYWDDTPPPEAKMTLVQVLKNIIIADGHFVSSEKFNKSISREGWLGYWAKAELPTPPHDGNNYFIKPEEK